MEQELRAPAAIIAKITGLVLLLSLAAVFLFSGWSKLQTIEPFAATFMEVLPLGITAASVLARLFIGVEWLIGAWLAAHLFLRRITYPATAALLILLTIYLAALIVRQGDSGNCGCFGDWLYMKPSAAIWKNIAMIAAVALLRVIYPARPYRDQIYVGLATAVAAFTLPFVFEPVRIHGAGQVVHERIDLEPLYHYGAPPPSMELRKGKHIVCFFSTTCPHCKKAAFLVQILHRRYPQIPLFIALNGNEGLQKSFMAETKAAGVPHTLLDNTPVFSAMAGEYVPAIYWISNSVIERKSYYTELEPAAIRAWLREK